MHVDRSATRSPDLDVSPASPSPSDEPTVREIGPSPTPALGVHPWVLAIILFAIIPIVGTDSVWSADVGAQLYQATALTDGTGWVIPHPFPAADPSGHFFPIHLSSFAESADPTRLDRGAGYVVFRKHTAFTWIVAGLFQLGGFGAVIAFSAASTLAASVGTARLTGLLHRPAAVPALWITGLASPLFFDGYVGYAHTFGAALIAWGAFFLLRFVSAPRPARNRCLLLAAVPLCGAPMTRTEAPLAGIALGLGLASIALVLPIMRTHATAHLLGPSDSAGDNGKPMTYGIAGVVAIVATMVGLILDRRLAVPVSGLAERSDPVAGWSFVDGRIEALVRTWFLPGGDDGSGLLVIVAFALVVAAAAVARLAAPSGVDSTNTTVIRLILIGAAGAMLARLILAPPATIPGLLLAFPLLVAGLVLVKREDLRNPRFATLAIGFALFCGAVLATQYPLGGTAEWGGRYFAVGLPLGVAIATPGLVRFAQSVARPQRAQLAALVAVVVVLTSSMGVLTLRTSRQRTEQLVADIEATLAPAGDADGSPVVLTTAQPVSRWAWSTVNQGRWLRIEGQDLAGVSERLTELGVDRLTFVSWDAESDLEVLSPWYEVDDGAAEISEWGESRIFVLRAVRSRAAAAPPEADTVRTGP